jgi:hypothetical protein
MASVECADAGCAQSLGNGDEAAIDAAEVLIGVLNGERGESSPVGCRQRFDADLAGGCGLVERAASAAVRAAGRSAIRSWRSRARS